MIQLNKIVVWFLPVLFIAILGIVGCTIVGKNKRDQVAEHKEVRGFSHKVHEEGGIGCKSCHVKASKKVKAGMPNEMLCGFCHKTVYDDQPVGEIYNRKEWELSHNISRIKYAEINMSHQQHMSVGVECADCHGNVANSVKVTLEHIPVKETCSLCHKEVNDADKCDTCHKEIRYDVPPPTHKNGNFKRMHGQLYREESISPDKSLETIPSCYRCHSNDSCVKCHQDEPPVNHNNQWRLRGHGITVGIDRNACSTCHKTDFCVRCHESTKPMNHVASGWGNPNNRHCKSCHMPVSLTGCSVCHKETPSHFEGAPGSHRGGWGNPVNKHCVNCHIEDSTCSVCHRGTPSHKEVEPFTHNAQWSSPKHKHCQRCHIPISTSVRCKPCHDSASAHLSDAPLRPDDLPHRRPLMCRSCHFGGSNLKHADNGLDCRLCHKL
ncbi:MAG: cytochrome c3 family protein [Candidatus Anammoxibacter sp.]